jgi:phosphatidylinositol glycan class V
MKVVNLWLSRNVGFLRYFQLKQLPNFLLASPILSLAFYSVVHYAKSRPKIFFSLGFDTTIEEKSCGVVFMSEDLSRFKVAGSVEKSSVRSEGIIVKQILMFCNCCLLGSTLSF